MEMIISSKHNYDVGCIIVQIMSTHIQNKCTNIENQQKPIKQQ